MSQAHQFPPVYPSDQGNLKRWKERTPLLKKQKKVDGDKNANALASFPMPLLVVVGVQSKDAIY